MLQEILNLPISTGLEEEKDVGRDNRYKLLMLHKRGEKTKHYNILALPYGADLRAKVEIPSAIYIEASPDNVRESTIPDPVINLVKNRSYTYPLIKLDNKKAVIPYKTKNEFPENYSNIFYSHIQEHLEEKFSLFEKVVEKMEDVDTIDDVKELKSDFSKLMCSINKLSDKTYNLIDGLFYDEKNTSYKMNILDRRMKDMFLRNFKIRQVPDNNKDLLKFLLKKSAQELILEPIISPIYNSPQRRNIMLKGYLKGESSRNRIKDGLAAINEMYPKLFNFMENTSKEGDAKLSKRNRNISIIAGLGTTPFSLPAGLGIISYGLISRYFEKKHAKNQGTYTGLIGRIRDFFVEDELRDFDFFDVPKKGTLI